MRTKATFLAGFGAGYVLGARAGRARYEQIYRAARAFASNPAVQSTATQLQHQAGDVLITAKDRATDVIAHKIPEKMPSWRSRESYDSADDVVTVPEANTTQTAGSNGHVTNS